MPLQGEPVFPTGTQQVRGTSVLHEESVPENGLYIPKGQGPVSVDVITHIPPRSTQPCTPFLQRPVSGLR